MSSLKKYKKIKYLGKGSYGAAILVELRADPSQKFVIKEIVIGHLKPAEQQSAKNEAEVLHQMNHSNITSYIESFVENSKLYIVMEHADGGDLSGAIQKKKADNSFWQEDEVMRIFVQICLALKHVHSANILHRDLKSQNIFLTQKGMVKLGDFGIAKVLDASEDQARTQIGTPYYLSPEICESKPYGRKSDVWSLGVVLYELLALEMPFQASSLPALVHRICTVEPAYTKLEPRYSQPLLSLCKKMLMKNPDLRPSLAEIVKNDFVFSHISRLLSFTLKSGTGGVSLSQLPAPSASSAATASHHQHHHHHGEDTKDAEEADHRMERLREKEKEMNRNKDQESKDAQIQRERALQTEEARDKARKIRQEMISNNNNVRRDAKESDNRAQRPLSPKSQRPLSPKSRAAAANNYPNNYPPQQQQPSSVNRNVGEAPRVNPFGRQGSQQPVSSLANNNNNNRGPAGPGGIRSLAEIQQERNYGVMVTRDNRGESDNYARR
jgi:NIMA (never in mitosis gene a)-related kinase